MKRKIISSVMAAMLIGSMLSGCGAGSATTTDPTGGSGDNVSTGDEELESGTVELTVWGEADTFDLLNEMIDSFKAEYAGQADFVITLVEQGDATTKDNLLADVHNDVDVFSFPDDQLPSMIAAGVLSPVANADEVSSANLEEAVEASSYNGILYAYPYTADNGYFLYYDKRVLSEEDVQTMDGVLAACAAAGKVLSMEFDSGWYLYSFFGATGLEFGINDDGVTNYCNWNSTEGTVLGVDIAQALLEIAAHPGFAAQPDSAFQNGLVDGTVAAGISGVWNAMAVREAWGDDYGACKLPTYTCGDQQIQMSSFTGYKMMGVNSYSDHLAWAHKLADWLTNEENQTLRFEKKNQGPSNIKAAASEEVGKVPAIQAVISQAEFGTLQRVGNNYWDPCTAFGNTIAAGNPQGTPLQEIMDNLVAGITASTVQ